LPLGEVLSTLQVGQTPDVVKRDRDPGCSTDLTFLRVEPVAQVTGDVPEHPLPVRKWSERLTLQGDPTEVGRALPTAVQRDADDERRDGAFCGRELRLVLLPQAGAGALVLVGQCLDHRD